MERVGSCSVCGKNAAVNTPCVDKEGNLYCYECSRKQNKLLQGIDQYKDDNGRYITVPDLVYGECSVFVCENEVSAYLGGGTESFYLTPAEQKLPLEEIIGILRSYVDKGWHRCSSCGKELRTETEIAGRPLFAGICCEECWKKHLELLAEERRKGYICSMCGRPYSNCCC